MQAQKASGTKSGRTLIGTYSKEVWYVLALCVIAALFVANRWPALNPASLWLDDLYIAVFGKMNLWRDWHLWLNMHVPLAFMLGTFLSYRILPDHELSAQLLPFACALAQIFLFARLARIWTGRRLFALLAGALLSVCTVIVIYSVRVKQYTLDSLITILLLLLFTAYLKAPRRERSLWPAALASALALLASFISAVISGIFLHLLLARRLVKDRFNLKGRLGDLAGVLAFDVSGALYYWFVLRGVRNPGLMWLWDRAADYAFLPVHAGFPVFFQALARAASESVLAAAFPSALVTGATAVPGLQAAGLYLVAAVVLFFLILGLRRLWQQGQKLLVAISLIFYCSMLAMSALALYPLFDRTNIYSFPVTLLLVVLGVQSLAGERPLTRAGRAAWVLVLLAATFFFSSERLGGEPGVYFYEEQMSADYVRRIERAYRPGDAVVVYPMANVAFAYYTRWPVSFRRDARRDWGYEVEVKKENVNILPYILTAGRDVRDDPGLLEDDLKGILNRTYPHVYYFSVHYHDKADDYIQETIEAAGYGPAEEAFEKGCELIRFQPDYLRCDREAQGLGPWEGPYPQFHLSQVRWGYGPATSLRIQSPKPVPVILELNAKTSFPGQAITVFFNRKFSGRYTLPVAEAFTNLAVPGQLQAGENSITLEYAHWKQEPGGDARPLAVLYSGLWVRRAE